jgi:hypothetical protein
VGVLYLVVCGVAHAQATGLYIVDKEFKGTHSVEKDFDTYSVKKIGLSIVTVTDIMVYSKGGTPKGVVVGDGTVDGSWKWPLERVTSLDHLRSGFMTQDFFRALEKKGYQMTIWDAKDEKKGVIDAKLEATLQPIMGKPLTGGDRDWNVSGNVRLSLAKAGKKVIYKASGQTVSAPRPKQPGESAPVASPTKEFCKILDPLPPAPK